MTALDMAETNAQLWAAICVQRVLDGHDLASIRRAAGISDRYLAHAEALQVQPAEVETVDLVAALRASIEAAKQRRAEAAGM